MSATVDAREFSQALDKVSKGTAKYTTISILEGVLVQIANGRCTLTATDLSTYLAAEIPAQGDDLSFVLLRIKDTARAFRRFEGELTLEVTESGKDYQCDLTISCGSRAAKIKAGLAIEFPLTPRSAAESSFTINAAQLLKRVDRVKYALRKPGREEQAAACKVQFSGSNIFALDGYRMAWDTDESMEIPKPFMLSPGPLSFLKLFGEQNVSIQLGEYHLQISGDGLHIITKLTEDRVFDMSKAVPKRYLETISVNTKDFLKELSYLKEFIPATGKPYVRFFGGEMSMHIAGEDYLTTVQIHGESTIEFAFDLRQMLDALKQFKDEAFIQLKLNSPSAPIVLEAEGRNDGALLVPVKMKVAMAA